MTCAKFWQVQKVKESIKHEIGNKGIFNFPNFHAEASVVIKRVFLATTANS